VIFAIEKNKTEYKIYNCKKGFVLETKKKKGNWRKDNRHNGKLEKIIALIS
jgi:hypothetical protein